MTTPDTTALAAEIAARFGETGDRPRAQIARMIDLMGAEWVRSVADHAQIGVELGVGDREKKGGGARTPGGVFFAEAREFARHRVALKALARRDFFRCFTDRPPKAPPVKAPSRPRMPRGASVTAGNVRRQPRAAVPEVYMVRGRAGAGR